MTADTQQDKAFIDEETQKLRKLVDKWGRTGRD